MQRGEQQIARGRHTGRERSSAGLAYIILIWFLLLLVACARPSPPPPPTPFPVTRIVRETVVVTHVVTRVITPTAIPATPVPDRVVLCVGQEPSSLDPLEDDSEVGALVRALITGSVIALAPDGTYTTDLFTRVPSPENGDARLVGPEGPDGHLEVTFRLRNDVRWEDGTPLTARDFITAWQWARRGRGSPEIQARAADVVAMHAGAEDTFTVVLRQGLITPLYATYVFGPYPSHLLEGGPDPQARLDELARKWPALGPYLIKEWRPGEALVLTANPSYAGAKEGLPRVHTIVVRFFARSEDALVSLLSGRCDIIPPGLVGPDAYPILQTAQRQGIVKTRVINGPAWEHLDFNTWPPKERIPFFADSRVRQAVALALDREGIARRVTNNLSHAMTSWLPSDHWAYQPLPPLAANTHDVGRARALLDEVGWQDEDGDGVREAHAVAGQYWDGSEWQLEDGTPFSVTLVIPTGNVLHEETARAVQEALHNVGIKVRVDARAPEALFGDGGVLRSRRFDLALFAWIPGPDVGGRYLWIGNEICRRADGSLYAADAGLKCEPGDETLYPSQIPTEENGRQGGNYAGWANPEASLAIYQATMHLRPEERASFYLVHQDRFGRDLPVLPLYLYPEITVWREGLKGIAPGRHTPLTWNAATWTW